MVPVVCMLTNSNSNVDANVLAISNVHAGADADVHGCGYASADMLFIMMNELISYLTITQMLMLMT